MSWKSIHETSLRGALCTVWMASFVLSAFQLVNSQTNQDFAKCLGYWAVGVIAIAAHAWLLDEKLSEEKPNE